MPNNQKKIIPINYTNREYSSIRDDLMQIAERFYPSTFQDFSEASFGSLMLDAVAYVSDQLNFYLDYNVNECFLDTAYQYKNIIRHGRILGYKDPGPSSTYGQVAIYIMVPATSAGLGPDEDYIPVLKRGSLFKSTTGQSYILTEHIDFKDPKNPVVVARVDSATGAPTYFAIKAYGNVVSGRFATRTYTMGRYQRFAAIDLEDPGIAEIISVFDSQGRQYFEVDYLSQDLIFKEVVNKNYKQDNVPSIIKPMLVSRKFVVERSRIGTTIQFGSGQEGETDVVANPQQVALDIFGKSYTSDTTFDPTRLDKTHSYGISPSNTNITVAYRFVNPTNNNVAAGAINEVTSARFDFGDVNKLSNNKLKVVQASVEVQNEAPIMGGVKSPTSAELKSRIYDTFPTQNRAVTQADYESLAYRMPGKFGSIKRVSIQKDSSSLKRNLNMYVISEDKFKKLTLTNSTIKNNLKTWINQYRMMNDTIDIIDPFIINFGIEFIVKPAPGVDKYTLLNQVVKVLSQKYKEPFFIGEPLVVSDIYQSLKDIPSVLDVVNVKIVNKSGSNYSSTILNIAKNMSPDGDQLIVPKNGILELKYPKVDIVGKIR